MASIKVVILLLTATFAASTSTDDYRTNLLERKERIRPAEFLVTTEENEGGLNFQPSGKEAQEEIRRVNFQRSPFPAKERNMPHHQGDQQFNGFRSASLDAIQPSSSPTDYRTDNGRATHLTNDNRYSYSIGTMSDTYPAGFERESYSPDIAADPNFQDKRSKTLIATAPLKLYSHSLNGRTLAPGQHPSYPIYSASPLLLKSEGNLPNLPALAYVSHPNPQSLVYGHDSWYHGRASVRQHLQAPYVNYAYRHFL